MHLIIERQYSHKKIVSIHTPDENLEKEDHPVGQKLLEQEVTLEKEVEDFQNINYSPFGQFSALMSSSATKFQKIMILN